MTKETCLDCGFDGLALQTQADALLARVDSLTKFVKQAEAERDAARADAARLREAAVRYLQSDEQHARATTGAVLPGHSELRAALDATEPK